MWNLIASNAVALKSFYRAMPSCDQWQLRSCRFLYDGPTVNLGIALPFAPDLPSPKWPVSAQNLAFHLVMVCDEIRVEKFGTSNICAVHADVPQRGRLKLHLIGPDIDVLLVGYQGRFEEFSAF